MREYDLMRSIGEVDEKLLNRYDPETAKAVRRAARRKRLLIDLLLLLLLAGLVLWLILGQGAAEAVEPQAAALAEAAARLEPLPFSFPQELRLLTPPMESLYYGSVTVDFDRGAVKAWSIPERTASRSASSIPPAAPASGVTPSRRGSCCIRWWTPPTG